MASSSFIKKPFDCRQISIKIINEAGTGKKNNKKIIEGKKLK